MGILTPFPDKPAKAATALSVDESGNWLAVGGTGRGGGGAKGVVCHLASRQVTATFSPAGHEVLGAAFHGDKLFTVGNGDAVEHWQPTTGARVGMVRTGAAASPLYSVTAGRGASASMMLVTGSSARGQAPGVDVLLNDFGNHAFSLKTTL